MTTTPLHVGTVGGQPLRFFKTPLNDGRPDLVWHAVDDLQCCLGLNRAGRKFFLHVLRSTREWGAIIQTVATADGVITIAPHFVAQGLIGAMVEEGMARASIEPEYGRASAEAQKKLGVPFPFLSDEFFAWMKAAMNRWEPAP